MKKLLSCIVSVLLLLPALVWPVVAEENAASQETSAAEESASAGARVSGDPEKRRRLYAL